MTTVPTRVETGPGPGRVTSLGTRVPTGWYRLGASDDLADGRARPVQAFGVDLVAWATADGVHAADAFCPHMGAHLGHGGTVVDDHLECPFHAWRFDREGEAAVCSVPRPGPAEALTVHPTRRVGDGWYVFLQHDPDQPLEPWTPTDFGDHDWGEPDRLTISTETLTAHQQVVIEGDLDVAHFPVLHGRTFELSEAELGDRSARIAYAVTEPSAQRVELELDGVSRVRQRVEYGDVKVMLTGDYTTLDASSTRVDGTVALWGPSDTVDVLGDRIERLLRRDIARDAAIWERRDFDRPPVFGPDDATLVRFRRWSTRFYGG